MKITKTELLEALAKLDVTSDADWTVEGLPSVERVADLTLDNTVTRQDITVHALGFDREVGKGVSAAKDEVAADDETRLGAAKPLDEASKDAQDALDKVVAASEPSQADADARRKELAAAVDAAKEGIAGFDQAIQKARASKDKMIETLDQATKDLEAEFPPMRHADAVREWLDSEARKRQARNGAPAEIDRRFQRPMGYGNRRPNVPPVASHG